MAVKGIPGIRVLVDRFKALCKSIGWRSTDQDDWIRSGDEYHKFFWLERITHDFIPSFRRLLRNDAVYVSYKGGSSTLDKASYTAWVFPCEVPESVFELVAGNPDLEARTAIYDLCPTYRGKPEGLKMNKTESVVFKEFELFLKNEYGIELVEITESTTSNL